MLASLALGANKKVAECKAEGGSKRVKSFEFVKLARIADFVLV